MEPSQFGILLRKYRVDAGLTQEELAERASLSARVVSDLERGVSRTPRAYTVRQLADALDLSPEDRVRFTGTSRNGLSSGSSEPAPRPPDRIPDQEETAEVRTFLIADMRGYTHLGIEYGDETAAALALRFAEVTEQTVAAREGRIVELRDDEALAVFSSTRQALRAAVDLQAQYAQSVESSLPLRVGIGLDVGEAVLVKGGRRGAALNLAARLCSLAGAGEILASEGIVHTARTVENVGFVERGLVEFKGFSAPVRIVEVVPSTEGNASIAAGNSARSEDESKGTALPFGGFLGSLPSVPIVARDDELDRIRAIVDAVESGAGKLLFLSGERGVGKTRVAQEVMLELRNRGFLVVTGRCYESEEAVPFYPFIEAVAAAVTAAPPEIQSAAARRWPYLGGLIPDVLGMRVPPLRETAEERLRVMRAVVELVSVLAETRAMAILLDDLQWADQDSLELLKHLARATRTSHTFLLGAYRDTEISAEHRLGKAVRELTREQLLERIPIRRLNPEGTTGIVTATLGDAESSEDFLEFVHRRTRGNPFYIHGLLRTLGGRYRLIRLIGSGGMGKVFEAVDTLTGERVAIKLMLARTEADTRAVQRLEHEGAVLASLKHPNIVKIQGTFLDEHACCIVMELLRGRSLGEIMRTESLDLQRVKHLMEQTAAALACAHDHGVVHRDVKPDNIMVLDGDQVKVTDFGIARMLRPVNPAISLTATGMTIGTPLYMAPEQVGGRKVDGRADIYSLGAVMYELTTGRAPFTGDDPLTVGIRHIQEAPVPPAQLNTELPASWEAVIMKALAKEPDARFVSAAALGAAVSSLDTRWESEPGQPAEQAAGNDRADAIFPRVVRPRAGDSPAEGTRRLRPFRIPGNARRNGLLAVVCVLVLTATSVVRGFPLPIGRAEHAATVSFGQVEGVSVDAHGNVYAVDTVPSRIFKLNSRGALLAQWPMDFKGPRQTLDFSIIGPDGSALDRLGNLYVADSFYHGIQRLPAGGTAATLWPADITKVWRVTFNPTDMARDATGNLYVVDPLNNLIVKVSPHGKFTRWGELRHQAGLQGPSGIAVNASGEVYVADSSTGRILEFSPAGKLLRSWGGNGTEPGKFESPAGMTVDGAGDVYIADAANHRIQEFSAAGHLLRIWTGTQQHPFNQPVDVKVDAAGALYVVDSANNVIDKLSPRGQLISIWGPMLGST